MKNQQYLSSSNIAFAWCEQVDNKKIEECKKEDDDDDIDLFGSDDDDEEDEEAAKIREERLKQYAAKKSNSKWFTLLKICGENYWWLCRLCDLSAHEN